MEESIQVSAKTVEDAVLEAAIQLGTTRDKVDYEVVTPGSSGFLGIGSKKAVIRARKKTDAEIEAGYKAEQEMEALLERVKEKEKNPVKSEEKKEEKSESRDKEQPSRKEKPQGAYFQTKAQQYNLNSATGIFLFNQPITNAVA